MRRIKIVLPFLFSWLLFFYSQVTVMGVELSCPGITQNHKPALFFVTEKYSAEDKRYKSDLYAAYLDPKEVQTELIASGKYLTVAQLDSTVFLIKADDQIYAADFSSGNIKFLAESNRIHLLRTEPERKAAMLIDSNMASGEVKLIELGLENFKTEKMYVLSKKMLGDDFCGIGPNMKISPDFQRVAYICNKSTPDVTHARITAYQLKLLDLQTLKSEILDGNVLVEISMASSHSFGTPPFEWINNQQVLYQDMITTGKNEPNHFDFNGLYVFKIADIETHKITECFRKELRLTLDGGSLLAAPSNGWLIYNNACFLDLENKMLVDKNLPFSIASDYSLRKTEIKFGKDIIYTGSASSAAGWLSTSGENFAYLLRSSNSIESVLYVFLSGYNKTVKVAEIGSGNISIIGWIE
jgi:hypothetical protein